VWTNRQSTPGGSWPGWTRLPSPPTTFVGNVVVGRNADGRLELFVRAHNGEPWRAAQQSVNGSDWSDWQRLGGRLTSNPTVVLNGGGGLEVFGCGGDNALWHVWQLTPGGPWSPWRTLGGVLGGGAAVGLNPNGGLDAFVRGSNRALYHVVQSGAGGAWSGWRLLGGVLRTDPAVGTESDGRLQVFAIGTDNAVYRTRQAAPGNIAWSSWARLGGRIGSMVAVFPSQDGRLEIVARADGGLGTGLFHSWQTAASGSGWSGWAFLAA
jgi:hypothetical protein